MDAEDQDEYGVNMSNVDGLGYGFFIVCLTIIVLVLSQHLELFNKILGN